MRLLSVFTQNINYLRAIELHSVLQFGIVKDISRLIK